MTKVINTDMNHDNFYHMTILHREYIKSRDRVSHPHPISIAPVAKKLCFHYKVS